MREHLFISATLVGEQYPAPARGLCYCRHVPAQGCNPHRRRLFAGCRQKGEKLYDPEFIEAFAAACRAPDESIFRILYYDCAMYTGTVKLPVSGTERAYAPSDAWLHALSHKDLFAVRRGVLKFRGFKPKRTPVAPAELTDADFEPIFEQKGVDMRIGLDIAAYAHNRAVERILLVTADTDCVPALKYGRKAGMQMILIAPAQTRIAPELLAHADFRQAVDLP